MYLNIKEIYHSIQGESSFVGKPCVFVRTAGCSLRCRWCDTEYAFEGGRKSSFEEIADQVRSLDCSLVLLTGGEPLDQPESYDFLKKLCDEGYTVLLETGGHLPIKQVDSRVHRIMDVKCPSSNMEKKNLLQNLSHLSKKDEVKFVIGNRDDYEYAKTIVSSHELAQITNPVFSPVFFELPPKKLAQWILDDRLDVRLQMQLHKSIWGEAAKGV